MSSTFSPWKRQQGLPAVWSTILHYYLHKFSKKGEIQVESSGTACDVEDLQFLILFLMTVCFNWFVFELAWKKGEECTATQHISFYEDPEIEVSHEL